MLCKSEFILSKEFIIWIIISIIFVFLNFTCIYGVPVVIQRDDSTITFGNCKWVFDRKCPDIDVKFYLFTRENPEIRQYIYIDETWERSNLSKSYFNPYHPVKIIIHGYNSDMFLHPLIQMKDEYLLRDYYNVFYVDWSILGQGPCYIMAVHNTKQAGKCTAQLVERILEAGTADIHMIGFSLGAHVTNFVATNLHSYKLPRITGLDPAMPLFITAGKDDKLDSSDAHFVDVIHTNAFVQGKIERSGHVDFYMNGGILQPGCWANGENPIPCSHHRAPDYFTESIRSYRGFWGWSCSNYISYILGLCPPTNYEIVAGEDCKSTSRGMHLVKTYSSSPYAMGRFIDNVQDLLESSRLTSPFFRHYPHAERIDQWGKLDGSFNNIMLYPTPYTQDPNGLEWPYFSILGTSKITKQFQSNINKQHKSTPDNYFRLSFHEEVTRKSKSILIQLLTEITTNSTLSVTSHKDVLDNSVNTTKIL